MAEVSEKEESKIEKQQKAHTIKSWVDRKRNKCVNVSNSSNAADNALFLGSKKFKAELLHPNT